MSDQTEADLRAAADELVRRRSSGESVIVPEPVEDTAAPPGQEHFRADVDGMKAAARERVERAQRGQTLEPEAPEEVEGEAHVKIEWTDTLKEKYDDAPTARESAKELAEYRRIK